MSHDPSNPLAIFEQAKANLPAAPVRDKTAADGMQGGGFPRITLRGSRFRPIIDGKEGQAAPGEYLDVIIVDWMVGVGRLFYEKGYEPNSSEPPTCFSDDGDKAHASSAARQHPTCRGCPHDAENSGQSGRGRACGFAKRLVVQVVGDPHRLYGLLAGSRRPDSGLADQGRRGDPHLPSQSGQPGHGVCAGAQAERLRGTGGR